MEGAIGGAGDSAEMWYYFKTRLLWNSLSYDVFIQIFAIFEYRDHERIFSWIVHHINKQVAPLESLGHAVSHEISVRKTCVKTEKKWFDREEWTYMGILKKL